MQELAAAAGVDPREFWALTAAEVDVVVRGYAKRQTHELERTAWLACAIINSIPFREKAITVDQLLGRSTETQEQLDARLNHISFMGWWRAHGGRDEMLGREQSH